MLAPPKSYCCLSMPSCGGWRRRSWPTKSRDKRSTPRGWFTKPTCDCSAAMARAMASSNSGTAGATSLPLRPRPCGGFLIENARRKKRVKHGGDRQRVDLLDEDLAIHDSPDELLALDAALTNLAVEDSTAAQLVKLRVFTGLSIEQAAEVLGFSRATAYRHWNYARAWLRCEIEGT